MTARPPRRRLVPVARRAVGEVPPASRRWTCSRSGRLRLLAPTGANGAAPSLELRPPGQPELYVGRA
eukprot:7390120-Lingulodinium_polyedra.AAC.1